MYLLRADDKSLWSTGSNPTRPGTQHGPAPSTGKRSSGGLATCSRAQLWLPAAPPCLSTASCAEGRGTAGVGRGLEGGGKEAKAGEDPGLRGVKRIVPPPCFLAHSGSGTQ